MKRLELLLKIYFRHFRTYVVIYMLIVLSIVIPVSIEGLLSGMIDDAFSFFLQDQVLSGDVLVASLEDNSMAAGDRPALSRMTEYYIDEAVASSFSSPEECTYELYSFIYGQNEEYFIYEDLMEPGQQVSLIVSNAIPEGVFSAKPSSALPQSAYLVAGKDQSYTELKKSDDYIPFPRAFMYDIAISRSDANRLMIPAKRAYITIDFHGASQDEVSAFINELSTHPEFMVLTTMNTSPYEILRRMAPSTFESYSMLTDLRLNVLVLLSGFALISICAMLFSAVHVFFVRKDEYVLYRNLGMTKACVRKTRLLESLITAIIPIAVSWVLTAVICSLVSLIPGPSMLLDAETGLNFTDVYCVDGHLFMPFPVSQLLLYSALYLVVVLLSDLIAERRGKQ